jgi:hypothetical protein
MLSRIEDERADGCVLWPITPTKQEPELVLIVFTFCFIFYIIFRLISINRPKSANRIDRFL